VHDDPFELGDRQLEGPCRLDAPTTSVWVPSGWTARRDRGLLRLDRVDGPRRPPPLQRTPHTTALWAQRIRAVATDAGAVLQRLARSVNVRERLDFSCAVFDGDGRLVANAPHVPVHLGAMGATVRHLLAHGPPLEPGQHYLCNDPAAGGSHLPDLTVVHPCEIDGQRLFVANRAHHVDVGGLVPGSMPPTSRTLADEGFVVRHLPLLRDGRLRPDLARHLDGCRQLDTVRADLGAQIAANVAAARLLSALGPAVVPWCAHLLDAAEEAIEPLLARLPPAQAHDTLAGTPLHLRLEVRGHRLVVDLSGSGDAMPGNLNAPSAVVRAAVLYALRVATGQDLPLNDGLLRRVDLRTRPGSVLSPPEGAAVAGGNVETSQRVVDLMFAAAGVMAASAGTMSNLTLGGPGWSLYETVGGGQGASPVGPGASGRQLHMTNTRATDAEVLEARLPVAVRRFALRRGSGGDGRHPGGDGIVRELELLQGGTAALLATRRDRGAPGMGGGGPGLPRADELVRAGRPVPWNGRPVELQPGDRVRVVTPGGGGFGTT
jgi:5-oxoprolinase (ATP-hydrolysing)